MFSFQPHFFYVPLMSSCRLNLWGNVPRFVSCTVLANSFLNALSSFIFSPFFFWISSFKLGNFPCVIFSCVFFLSLSHIPISSPVIYFSNILSPVFHAIFLFNPLNPELNPICYLLASLAHHFLHVSRIRVKSLTLRLLMSYIWRAYSWCF